MALEKVPADIRKDGGIARMSDPEVIKDKEILKYLLSVMPLILVKLYAELVKVRL
jgi:pyridoxal biosynthesis lyase PdxS